MEKSIYQIKISLKASKPIIWRRVLVYSNISLTSLHDIIQIIMGWSDSHLHVFSDGKDEYAPKDFELEYTKNSKTVKLNSVLKKEKAKISYEYDLGDCWEHTIVLEKILEPDKDIKLPKCIAGKYSCPPEDSGGLWGYYQMLEVLKQPDHEEYEMYIDWLGEDYDPEYFDIEEVNKLL